MLCRICGEQWDLDSFHEALYEIYPGEVEALREEFGGKEQTWKHTNGFQKAYEGRYFNPLIANFRKRGCRALDPSATYCVADENVSNRTALVEAVYDVMGDDVDGAQSMLEDAEALGLF